MASQTSALQLPPLQWTGIVVLLHLKMPAQHAGRKINLVRTSESEAMEGGRVGGGVAARIAWDWPTTPACRQSPLPLPVHRPRGHEATNGRATCDRRGEGDKLQNASSQHHGQEGGAHIERDLGFQQAGWLRCQTASSSMSLSDVLGRRPHLRASLRDSAAPPDLSGAEDEGLLGLPFAKHYREPSRVIAARRKEASRTVARRPSVSFCLRSRLPFVGRRGPPEGPSRLFTARGGSTQHPRFPISEVAAPGCCSSMDSRRRRRRRAWMDDG